MVLHYLEGKTYTRAAELLGWPEGTVAIRLARGRQMLRRRLARRGFTCSAGLPFRLFAGSQVSEPLLNATIKAGVAFGAGQAGAGLLSANVVGLTEGVLHAMFVTKVRFALVLVLSLCVLSLGAGTVGMRVSGAPAEAKRNEDPLKQEVERLTKENERLQKELRELQDKVTALEQKLSAVPETTEPVLYQGKPVDYWLGQLRDRDLLYRDRAFQALGSIGTADSRVMPALIRDLGDGIGGESAANALAQMGPESLPSVIRALNDKNPWAYERFRL
jgi:hypothetical protein